MAVTAKITGNGAYAGVTTDLVSYSSSEDATPIDPAETSGGVGQITFAAVDDPDGGSGSLLLLDDILTVSDGANGTTVGTITGIGGGNGEISVTADSRLGALLATRTAQPMTGTPESIYRYYLGLGGITSGIVYTLTGVPTTVTVPGWTGVIWDNLRAWAVSLGAEVSLVSNNIVMRNLRERVAINKRDSSVSFAAAKGQLARTVEINYYNNVYGTQLAYPTGGWNPDVQVYQVDAGETLEINVPVDATLTSVAQPGCVEYVGPSVTDNVYSVIGADGLAIKPLQWLNNGGSVTAKVGEDQKSIDFTIVGATTTQGPFRIAAGSGPNDAYSSLRVQGTGTFFSMKTLTLLTGVADSQTPQIVGVTVDSPFISTLAQAYELGLRTAGSYGGTDQSISVTTTGINRSDSSGSVAYPTFTQFNSGVNGKTTNWTGKTLDDFNAAWPNPKTFDDFSTFYYSLVQADFANQAFGNVAGARIKFRDAFYRINSASITQESVSYDATRDTTFDDFNAVWQYAPYEIGANAPGSAAAKGALTFDKMTEMFVGRSFDSFAVTPLWRKYWGYAGLAKGRTAASPLVLDQLLPATTLLPSDNLILRG